MPLSELTDRFGRTVNYVRLSVQIAAHMGTLFFCRRRKDCLCSQVDVP